MVIREKFDVGSLLLGTEKSQVMFGGLLDASLVKSSRMVPLACGPGGDQGNAGATLPQLVWKIWPDWEGEGSLDLSLLRLLLQRPCKIREIAQDYSAGLY